jgi:hypothetical protein
VKRRREELDEGKIFIMCHIVTSSLSPAAWQQAA